MIFKGLASTTVARGHVFPRVYTCDCQSDACEEFLDQIAEHVIDGGVEIVILCMYSDRNHPTHAYIMERTYGNIDNRSVEIPIPAFTRKDIRIPYYGNQPEDFGITW